MIFRSLLLSACVALGFSQSSISLSDCAPGSVFKIDSLEFSPSVPVPGSSGTLVTSYTVPNEVTGGTSHYTCTLNGLPVYDETFDLCTQTACPIKTGTHTDKSVSDVPKTSGKVVCTIDWKNSGGEELMCIRMTMKLAGALRGGKN